MYYYCLLRYRTVVCPVLSCLSVSSMTLVYCGQTVGWIEMKLGVEVGLGPGHIVLDVDPAHPLPPNGHRAHITILAHIYCGQTAGWIKMPKMPLGTKVGLGPGDIVIDGDPAPPMKWHCSPPLFGPCLLWPNGRPSQQLLSFCKYLFDIELLHINSAKLCW